MTQQSQFARRVLACEQQLNRPRLKTGLEMARQLTREFPREPKSWHLLNRMICLTNSEGGAASRSPKIITQAQRYLGASLTPHAHGDMLRDQGMSLTTFGTRAQLERVPKLIQRIRTLHADDPNRLARSIDLEARYYFARGNYARAIELHAQAHAIWISLGDNANQAWVANNMVRWLRAMVKHYGRGDRQVYDFAMKLSSAYPDKAWQTTILTSFCGPWLFQFLLTHR